MFAPRKRVVVGKITVAHGDAESHGYTVVVVILGIVVSHPPCVAVDDSVQPLYRTDKCAQELTHESREATLTVVENKV